MIGQTEIIIFYKYRYRYPDTKKKQKKTMQITIMRGSWKKKKVELIKEVSLKPDIRILKSSFFPVFAK